MPDVLFRIDCDSPDIAVPSPRAASGWGVSHMRGLAVSGILAREVEKALLALGRAEMIPARWTLDLHHAVPMAPCRTSATVVHEGRRLCVIDAELGQEGEILAQARALFFAAGQAPHGRTWEPADCEDSPPLAWPSQSDQVEHLYRSDNTEWLTPECSPLDEHRKHIWQFATPLVDGEPLTPFQAVASTADLANAATNLGTNGLEFINADVTLALTRRPIGLEIGLVAIDRMQRDGVVIGTARVLDRQGPLGIATVCSMSTGKSVDPRQLGQHGSV